MALYSLSLLPAPDHELERPASSLRIRNGVPQMACPICLDAVTNPRGSLSSSCGHSFCFSCINEVTTTRIVATVSLTSSCRSRQWAKTVNTCPICKASFDSIEKEGLGLVPVRDRSAELKEAQRLAGLGQTDLDRMREEAMARRHRRRGNAPPTPDVMKAANEAARADAKVYEIEQDRTKKDEKVTKEEPHSEEGEVEIERHSDGRVVRVFEDGTYAETHPDGSSIRVKPDGLTLVETSAGIILEKYPDGRQVLIAVDGSYAEQFPDGLRIMVDTDGKTTTQSGCNGMMLTA